MFPGKIYEMVWIGGAILIILIILSGVSIMSIRSQNQKETNYIFRLFWTAFFLRIMAMLVLLAISYYTWDMFYLVGARDEMVYYRVASEAAQIWKTLTISDAYQHILTSYKNDFSDTGFSTFLMFPVLLFGGAPVAIKIFLSFIGSFVVVRGYVLARLLIEEPAARLAGIFLAFYPISWFYSVIMLKEGVMIMLMIEAMIMIVKIQKSFKIQYLLRATLFIILLFFFRSAISILMTMVLGFSFFMQRKRTHLIFNIILAAVVLVVYYFFLSSTGRFDEYYDQYTGIDDFTQERLSYMQKINPFVALAGTPVFIGLAFVAPFPSMVIVPNAGGLPHSEYYYHIAGNLFWIILAFFSVFGLYYALRYRRKEMAVLLAFVIGYQFVLLKAMMFTSVRFSYPAKPFLLILAAYGIYHMKSKKWYPVYLALAVVMIVGWNYVRLKGRG